MSFDFTELDKRIAERVKEKKMPGVSVAIYGNEGLVFANGYGFGGENSTRPINKDTVFGIASMSKSMTTLACAILATEGKLSFDDPVIKYFPQFKIAGTPRQAVTLRHLAMHTAGIPPMEPLEWSIAVNTPGRDSEWVREMKRTSPNQMNKIEQVIDYIGSCGYETLGAPGEYMSYSNEAYAILSYVVDIASGSTLEEYLKEKVFKPVGMTRTILDLDGKEATAMAGGNITRLFEVDEENGGFTCDDNWSTLPPFRGCACVKSTAYDMARYYSCIAGFGTIDGVQAIPSDAIDLLVGSGFGASEKPLYCFGLNKRTFEDHVICEHAGGLHGTSTFGGLLLGEGYGLSALSNLGDADTDDICWMMYNAIIDEPLEKSHRFLHPVNEEFMDKEMLEGSYVCHEGVPVTVKVTVENGKLIANNGTTTLELIYCGETWFLTKRADNGGVGRMQFLVRNGKAWAVKVYTRIYQRA